jgi:hypothetical protein
MIADELLMGTTLYNMCGRYALCGPILRDRKKRPVGELAEWYPGLR